MGRGGARQGAGRPKKTYKTIVYQRTIRPEWKSTLDMLIQLLRQDNPVAQKVKNLLGIGINVI